MKTLKGFMTEGDATALALMARSKDGAPQLMKALSSVAKPVGQSLLDYVTGKTKTIDNPTSKAIVEWAHRERKQVTLHNRVKEIRNDIASYIERKTRNLTPEEKERLRCFTCPYCNHH